MLLLKINHWGCINERMRISRIKSAFELKTMMKRTWVQMGSKDLGSYLLHRRETDAICSVTMFYHIAKLTLKLRETRE